jgi:hypothetical protein
LRDLAYFVVPSFLLVAVACLIEDFVNAVLYLQRIITIITTTRTTTTILYSTRIATPTDITTRTSSNNTNTNSIQRTWPTVDENDLLLPILPREEELLRTHRSATTTATNSSRYFS